MRYATLLLLAVVLTGCVPFVAGMAGAEAVTPDPPARQRYIAKADRPDSIVTALRHSRVIEGMTRTEVELAWGDPIDRGENKSGTVYLYGQRGTETQTRVLMVSDTVRAIVHGQP